MNVIEIDSSDGEDGVTIVAAPNKSSPNPKPQPPPPTAKPIYQTLECRSFWKAGNYAVGPTSSSATIQGQLEHARVHPKFLHSNATSHKWAFGAIAELLDNAVDEIHNGATFLKVDKIDIMKDNSPALLFQDDGGGMDPGSIRKCMSLGYSSKKSNKTIGQYGNGFKTSTMRLGADVIVFSRASHAGKATQSVGLLSYTLLLKTGQDDVTVPMVDFDISGHWAEPIIYSSKDDWSSNLNMILEWSPFSSKDMLMQQFEDIGPHGTKIIIYNLWLNDEGIYELSFDDDDEDIRLRDDASRGSSSKLTVKTAQLQCHISYRFHYSLRAYASILYLRKFTNFCIILRGKTVEQYIIADDLKNVKKAIYRPQLGVSSKEVAVETTIGFNKEAPDLGVCGFNVYHKNRLIRPFWKVTGEGAAKGNFVVGVLEANFIEPAHDKQDFERSSLYIRLEGKLKQMVADYWGHNCHLIGHQPPGFRANTSNKHTVGHQPPGFGVNTSKKQTVKSQRLVNQGNTGFSVSAREEIHLDESFDDLSPNLPRMPEDHLTNGSAAGSYDEVVSEDGPQYSLSDQICEENIQLFMRCEAHRQKETELKNTIAELEKELEQGRRKCAQLAAHLETKRKHKSMKEKIQKKVS